MGGFSLLNLLVIKVIGDTSPFLYNFLFNLWHAADWIGNRLLSFVARMLKSSMMLGDWILEQAMFSLTATFFFLFIIKRMFYDMNSKITSRQLQKALNGFELPEIWTSLWIWQRGLLNFQSWYPATEIQLTCAHQAKFLHFAQKYSLNSEVQIFIIHIKLLD